MKQGNICGIKYDMPTADEPSMFVIFCTHWNPPQIVGTAITKKLAEEKAKQLSNERAGVQMEVIEVLHRV